jgi:hypothetical protein
LDLPELRERELVARALPGLRRSMFHGDARIPRTLKALVFQPGRITQVYLWPALRRVYSPGTSRRIATVVLLTAAAWPVLMAYQLFQFWITLREI